MVVPPSRSVRSNLLARFSGVPEGWVSHIDVLVMLAQDAALWQPPMTTSKRSKRSKPSGWKREESFDQQWCGLLLSDCQRGTKAALLTGRCKVYETTPGLGLVEDTGATKTLGAYLS